LEFQLEDAKGIVNSDQDNRLCRRMSPVFLHFFSGFLTLRDMAAACLHTLFWLSRKMGFGAMSLLHMTLATSR
jgi:hypothetical protein